MKGFVNKILSIITVSLSLSALISFLMPPEISFYIWFFFTNIGSVTAYMILSLLIYYLDDPDKAYKIIFTLIFTGWLNLVIKDFTAIPRPSNPLIKVSGFSFPSGHAQTSATFWTLLSYLYRNLFLFITSVVIIILVSISRVVLNVHYPLDVLGGVAVGLFVSVLFTIIILEEFAVKYRYLDLALHIVISITFLFSYLIYFEGYFLRYAGFILGLSFHKLIYDDGIIGEKMFKRFFKFSAGIVFSYLLFEWGTGPIEMFLSAFSLGIIIPLVKFKL